MDQYFKIEAPLYVPQRFLHHCSRGKDPCFIVTRYPTHWKYYCHRCRISGIKKIDNMQPAEIVKVWKANKIYRDRPQQKMKEVRLPQDFSNDIKSFDPKAYAWLLEHDITDDEIIKYNIGYSQYYKRLIFPVYQNDELVYWQGRSMEPKSKENSKWINIKQLGREDIYFVVQKPMSFDKVVLVEDILSAIKVGRVVNTIALLGSYISDDLILFLKTKEIYIWLDKDKTVAAIKYFMRLRATGIKTHLRVTSRDPKFYLEEEIRRKINGNNKKGF